MAAQLSISQLLLLFELSNWAAWLPRDFSWGTALTPGPLQPWNLLTLGCQPQRSCETALVSGGRETLVELLFLSLGSHLGGWRHLAEPLLQPFWLPRSSLLPWAWSS